MATDAPLSPQERDRRAADARAQLAGLGHQGGGFGGFTEGALREAEMRQAEERRARGETDPPADPEEVRLEAFAQRWGQRLAWAGIAALALAAAANFLQIFR